MKVSISAPYHNQSMVLLKKITFQIQMASLALSLSQFLPDFYKTYTIGKYQQYFGQVLYWLMTNFKKQNYASWI